MRSAIVMRSAKSDKDVLTGLALAHRTLYRRALRTLANATLDLPNGGRALTDKAAKHRLYAEVLERAVRAAANDVIALQVGPDWREQMDPDADRIVSSTSAVFAPRGSERFAQSNRFADVAARYFEFGDWERAAWYAEQADKAAPAEWAEIEW